MKILLAFTAPGVAFASLFGFRFIGDPVTLPTRLALIAVAVTAGVALVAGALQVRLVASRVGTIATRALVGADITMSVGATFGVIDIARNNAPYATGWIIDVAAIGWAVAAVSAVHFRRRPRERTTQADHTHVAECDDD